ncbi:MAG: T9SS type A sorting domain-containing protein [Bacteroidia bacterium]
MFGRVVGDSLEFSEYEDENTYLAKMNAYNYMKNDTTILYLDEDNDEDYQDFYAAMQSLNIGSFARVSDLGSGASTLADARTANEAISDENDIEYYKKAVNNIYLNKVAPVDSSLSNADSSALETIAYMNWIEAGDAIYSAAAKGKLFVSYITAWQKAFINAQHLSGNTYTLTVTDITGRIIFKEKGRLRPPYFTKDLDCSMLAYGMYIINLTTNKERVAGKFIKE